MPILHFYISGKIRSYLITFKSYVMTEIEIQARQILDRLVGFELSPVVWRKVPGGKSAGRVQSPAVRLLVEREREIESFNGSFTFKIIAEFKQNGETLKAELPNRFDTEGEAKDEPATPGKRTRKATSPEGVAVEAEPEAKSEE